MSDVQNEAAKEHTNAPPFLVGKEVEHQTDESGNEVDGVNENDGVVEGVHHGPWLEDGVGYYKEPVEVPQLFSSSDPEPFLWIAYNLDLL